MFQKFWDRWIIISLQKITTENNCFRCFGWKNNVKIEHKIKSKVSLKTSHGIRWSKTATTITPEPLGCRTLSVGSRQPTATQSISISPFTTALGAACDRQNHLVMREILASWESNASMDWLRDNIRERERGREKNHDGWLRSEDAIERSTGSGQRQRGCHTDFVVGKAN